MLTDVVGQVTAVAVVPPAPVQQIDFHFKLLYRNRIAGIIHRNHFKLLIFIGFIGIGVTLFRRLNAHILVVSGVFKTFLVDAKAPARLKHLGYKSKVQHAGQVAVIGQHHIYFRFSLIAEFAIKNRLLVGIKAVGRIVENKFGIFIKLSMCGGNAFGNRCFQTGSLAAMQPLRFNVQSSFLSSVERVAIGSHFYF